VKLIINLKYILGFDYETSGFEVINREYYTQGDNCDFYKVMAHLMSGVNKN
jgi:hypothetical protein